MHTCRSSFISWYRSHYDHIFCKYHTEYLSFVLFVCFCFIRAFLKFNLHHSGFDKWRGRSARSSSSLSTPQAVQPLEFVVPKQSASVVDVIQLISSFIRMKKANKTNHTYFHRRPKSFSNKFWRHLFTVIIQRYIISIHSPNIGAGRAIIWICFLFLMYPFFFEFNFLIFQNPYLNFFLSNDQVQVVRCP